MSMYELCYVSSAAEELRLKEQQRTMLLALSNLSITATQYNREKQKQQQQQKQTHTLDYQIKYFDESRPYSPYNDIAYTPFKWNSDDIHSRPPSLTCSISSNESSQHSKSEQGNKNLPISEINESRDAYGFKQPLQWINSKELDEINKKYKKVLDKQTKKWNSLLEANQQQFPLITSKLIRYARKGIPHHLRAKAWIHYSGAKQKMDNNIGVYPSLIKDIESGNLTKECLDSIKKDLHRTFPENIHFACDTQCDDNISLMNPKLQTLQRILSAFSIYSPQIGYCQSLNFLAGFLLLFEQDEEQVFWLLVTIVHDYFPPGMFDRLMEGGNLEQTVLMSMIYENMPGVWSKISNKKCFWDCEQKDNLPTVSLVTGHWFLTMFINILPVETVLRIWDCFFIEGFKVLYQAALTIVKLNEQRIMFVEDSVDTIQILQKMPQKLVDCHRFMESVFSKNGVAYEITVKDINKKRDFFKNRKRQKKSIRQECRYSTMGENALQK